MSSLTLITPYFWENRFKLLAGLLSLLVVDGLQLIIPRIIKWAIDDLTAMAVPTGALGFYAAAVASIAVLIGISGVCASWARPGASRRGSVTAYSPTSRRFPQIISTVHGPAT